ncbi:ornithine cyclodeaminase family protein [Cupriavidus sp. CV2]|uniref:ornithine cyclodeaminase family protein n=1 Tax=Cupriavidus ulmosensis TaxID=3065913 RepID=UPI00296B345A|nr:ornithine cyclodeaminase family protein [Cupriavidus sp. CV2]MDW3685999.1 ornithine cyclodeaminase family protein [Cupriavidus sp. CV2]
MNEPLWINEQDVVNLLGLGEAITALQSGLLREAQGHARNMEKTHVAWGANNLHAIGAVFTDLGLAATKTWAHTSGGAAPLLVLLDANNGSLRAVIEAFALGQLRTGGISGVATDWLAAPGADELAVIGTGKQAILQIAAVHAVRPLKRLRVFSPRAESRKRLIENVRAEFSFDATEATSVQQAVADAPMITLVTRASEPFIDARMIARGAHVNAVGAITPEREEFAQDLFSRSTRVVVDSVPAVKALSKEFMTQFAAPARDWSEVTSLAQLVAKNQRRTQHDDITLFKAMGMGLADLALGAEIYQRAVAMNQGRAFPHPQRTKPRLHTARMSAAGALETLQ